MARAGSAAFGKLQLVVGALTAAFPSVPLFGCLILNLLPVILFVLFCFLTTTQTQMMV